MVSPKGKKGGSSKKGGGRHQAIRVRPEKQTGAAAEASGGSALAQDAAPSGQAPLPLLNLGNTCYFNSALQVLASTSAVHESWGGGGRLAVRGALSGALAEFLKASREAPVTGVSSSGRGSKTRGSGLQPFNPQRLHAAVLKSAPQFKRGEEEDSHELLRLLLDGLEREELRARFAASEAQDAPASTVERVFGGLLASRVACASCGHEAASTEQFLDISIEISQAVASAPVADREEASGTGRHSAKAGGLSSRVPDAVKAAPVLSAKARKRQAKIARSAMEQERQKQRQCKAACVDDDEAPAQPGPEPSAAGTARGQARGGDGSGAGAAAAARWRLREGASAASEGLHEFTDAAGAAAQEAAADCGGEAVQAGEAQAEGDGGAADGEAAAVAGGFAAKRGWACTTAPGASAGRSEAAPAAAGPSGRTAEAQPARQQGAAQGSWSAAGGAQAGASGGATGSGAGSADVPTLEACIASFFAPEAIAWVCPAETAARKAAAGSGRGRASRRRSVSFSGEQPRVKLIPGSAEQRGTDFVRALRGETPFCRTVALGDGGRLLVTADVEAASRAALILGLHPLELSEDVDATLPDSIELACVQIAPVADSEDEAEQALVQAQAQALMDALADMVAQGGVERARRLASPEAAVRVTRAAAGAGWRVSGNFPADADGSSGGIWEYLEAATPSGSPSFAEPLHSMECGASAAHPHANAPNGHPLLARLPLSTCTPHTAATPVRGQPLAAGKLPGSGALSAAGAAAEGRAHGDELLADEALDDSSAASEGAGSASGEPAQGLGPPACEGAGLGSGDPEQGLRPGAPEGTGSANRDPEQGLGPWARFQEASGVGGAGPGEPSRDAEARVEQAAGPLLQGRGCFRGESQVEADAAEQSTGCGAAASPAGGDAEPGLASDSQRVGAADEASCTATEAGPCSGTMVEEASDEPASRGRTFEARALQVPGVRANSSGAAGSGQGFIESRAQTADPSDSGGGGGSGVGAGMPEQQGAPSQESGGSGSSKTEGGSPDCSKSGSSGAGSAVEGGQASERQGLLSEGSGGSDAGGAGLGGGSLLVAVQRAAEKEYRVRRAPAVLAVHLKRFQQNARGRPRKIEGAVAFPLHLDMGAFCEPSAPGSSAAYTLVGVIEHLGRSVGSGHYVAYVSRPASAPQAPNPEDRAAPGAAQPTTTAAGAEKAGAGLEGRACSEGEPLRACDGMRQAAEAVEAPGADVGRGRLCSEAGEGGPAPAAGAPGHAPGGEGCSMPNGKAAHSDPRSQGPGRRTTRKQAKQAADPLPAGLQPRGKGSPVGSSGGVSDKTAQRSAMASGAQAEDGAAAGAADAAGGWAGGADKVWWRVSDTHVRAVDWETVSHGQAYILVYERSGGC